MKNLIFIVLCLAFASTACSKKKSAGGPAVAVNQYYLSDGTCYDRKTNVAVDDNKCDSVKFYFEGGQCFQDSDKTEVDITKCTALVDRYYIIDGACYDKTENQSVDDLKCNADVGNDGGDNHSGNTNSGTCIGNYVWDNYGTYEYIRCAGADCAGWTLFSEAKREWVNCR